jgi:hypothetical protein
MFLGWKGWELGFRGLLLGLWMLGVKTNLCIMHD